MKLDITLPPGLDIPRDKSHADVWFDHVLQAFQGAGPVFGHRFYQKEIRAILDAFRLAASSDETTLDIELNEVQVFMLRLAFDLSLPKLPVSMNRLTNVFYERLLL